MAILARPLTRGGEIRMRWHLLEGAARKISRTASSTIAGETIALSNAVDVSLWLQSMMIARYLGFVPSFHLDSTDPLPLNTPLRVSLPSESSLNV